jgi:hypothetical protein
MPKKRFLVVTEVSYLIEAETERDASRMAREVHAGTSDACARASIPVKVEIAEICETLRTKFPPC